METSHESMERYHRGKDDGPFTLGHVVIAVMGVAVIILTVAAANVGILDSSLEDATERIMELECAVYLEEQ